METGVQALRWLRTELVGPVPLTRPDGSGGWERVEVMFLRGVRSDGRMFQANVDALTGVTREMLRQALDTMLDDPSPFGGVPLDYGKGAGNWVEEEM